MQTTLKNKMVKASPKNKNATKNRDKTKTKKEAKEATSEITKQDKIEIEHIGKAIVKKDGDVWDNLKRPQIELIKRTVARGADDDELKLFLNVCRGTQLNPFLRQVHFVKRWNSKEGREVGTIQVGIDGFRAIAEGGGQYAGSDDAIFHNEAEMTLQSKRIIKAPEKATVTVYKLMDGNRYSFTASARWSEYFPGEKGGYMWMKMPFGQLAKCAESLALRKAFPKLLSGLYTNEEMEQANDTKQENIFEKAKEMISKATDIKGLEDLKEKVGNSKKYNDKQKDELVEFIGFRLSELEPVKE